GDRADPAGRLVAVDNRKLDIHQDQVRVLALRHRHPFGTVHRLDQLVTHTRQQIADDLAIVLGVLDDQDALAHSAASIISPTRACNRVKKTTLNAKGAKDAQRSRRSSEAIDDPNDPLAHMRNVKIQQITESTLFRRPSCEKVAPSGQFEIRRSSSSVPSMTDGLSTLYQDLLSGSYDCVDRIVLNAFFRMGHSPGGFRVWWRALTGSDETLENAY